MVSDKTEVSDVKKGKIHIKMVSKTKSDLRKQ